MCERLFIGDLVGEAAAVDTVVEPRRDAAVKCIDTRAKLLW